MKWFANKIKGWMRGGVAILPASNRQERTAMDAVKYRNGREVKLGDEVVWRTAEGKAWSGTVVNSEPQWNTLGLVPPNVPLVYANPGDCLHAEDAFGPRDPVLPVAKEPETVTNGETPPPPEQPGPVVKPEPKAGEEGGPAIIASE